GGVGGNDLQGVGVELDVGEDVGTNGPRCVRERRAAEAGMKFFGDGGAAGLGAALEDEWLESGFGEVEGGDQAVVTATDDDDVALVGHGYAAPFTSLRISSAERRPGAPMMPPPGCVADPHM